MSDTYVLIGEMEGDYADQYERPVEAFAVSASVEKLQAYWEENREGDFEEFIDYRIEKVTNLDDSGAGVFSQPIHKLPCACGCGGVVEVTDMTFTATQRERPAKFYLTGHKV